MKVSAPHNSKVQTGRVLMQRSRSLLAVTMAVTSTTHVRCNTPYDVRRAGIPILECTSLVWNLGSILRFISWGGRMHRSRYSLRSQKTKWFELERHCEAEVIRVLLPEHVRLWPQVRGTAPQKYGFEEQEHV